MKDHIRHSNLIEGIDDPAEDVRSLEAWEWLQEQRTLSQPVILELHKRITIAQLGDDAGRFRSVPVTVGGHYPPNGMVMKGRLYGWGIKMIDQWSVVDPKEMHVEFEKIHPFIDGNGRTGRMIMWWHEKKLGREPTLIRSNEADRQYYYDWFREQS
jgi:fido (protein-threonine AMPylation protein)